MTASLRLHMLIAIAPGCELLAAVRALEWLQLEVHSQMVEHVAVLKGFLVAFEALVDFVRLAIDLLDFSFEEFFKFMILGSADHDTFKCFDCSHLFRLLIIGISILQIERIFARIFLVWVERSKEVIFCVELEAVDLLVGPGDLF